ncbi:MAG: uroporphyrinogen-III synthase [Deltaproteobacteria bacterium]|nr:uroporphyrinogen-III synthase [Deltaproteobacteria bacterium]
MATLISRHGGVAIVAPSMREVPLADQHEALAFARELDGGAVDVVLLLTGVGTRALVAAVAPVLPRERLVAALGRVVLVARGPKPVAALRELGLAPALAVPEPNTWRELLCALDAHVPVAGRRVAVQEYGIANPELLDGLAARGASVLRVPVYRWALPEDLGPLRAAIARLTATDADVALFTSATQVEHLVRVAAEEGAADALRAGMARVVVGSVGPVCSEALRRAGIAVDVEPTHPKMGPLVAETLRAAPAILATRRAPLRLA